MEGWDCLSRELKLAVFKLLADDVRKRKNLQRYVNTSYAVVCREWQDYFEPLNFRQLTLSDTCIPGLNAHVPAHKRHMVHHIWLRVVVNRYACPACPWIPVPRNIHNVCTYLLGSIGLF